MSEGLWNCLGRWMGIVQMNKGIFEQSVVN